MPDKVAPGTWHEGAPPEARGAPGSGAHGAAVEAEADRLRARRDNGRWSAVVGFGLLFGASFHSGFLFGGVAMILYGATTSAYWSWRLRRLLGDPWDYDPDLDGPQAPEWSRTGKPPATDAAGEDDLEPPAH